MQKEEGVPEVLRRFIKNEFRVEGGGKEGSLNSVTGDVMRLERGYPKSATGADPGREGERR